MILLALAAASAAQWTGPRTEQYSGPGYFCGGGYAIHLLKGDRALVLPESGSAGVQGVRLVLTGREVNLWSGARRRAGPVVLHFGDTVVTEQKVGRSVEYTVSDRTSFALRLTSDAFHGLKRDWWFFTRANFNSTAENAVTCLAAVSY
jgi:hypothetical protein